jgi:hypothetical protein
MGTILVHKTIWRRKNYSGPLFPNHTNLISSPDLKEEAKAKTKEANS